MKVADSVFKAYDIRGQVGGELTPELAYAVGRALADLLEADGPVVVGRDMRRDSALLSQQLREGLVHQGREVWDIGLVSSDVVYFAVGKFGLAGGAMVTASHNPGSDNGIKLCRDGAAPIGVESGLLDIKAAVVGDTYLATEGRGRIINRDVMPNWIDHALSFVQAERWPPYQVAVDAGNGMAGKVIPALESKVPLRIVEMDFKLDGSFPNHPANPLEVKNISDEIAEIKHDQLDFGLAFDGDGDRVFLIDELGRELSGNTMLCILAEHYLEVQPGATILCDVRCSRLIDEVVRAGEGKLHRTKVGHSFIKADMRRHHATLAGELSGHFYFADNYYADSGLIAALLVIDVLARSGLKLSQLAAKYQKYFQSGEVNFTVADKDQVIDRLAKQYQDGQQDRLDGLTVNYPDWWFNVRPSNTEPFLRLNLEAENEAVLKDKQAEITSVIQG